MKPSDYLGIAIIIILSIASLILCCMVSYHHIYDCIYDQQSNNEVQPVNRYKYRYSAMDNV